MKLAIMQPYIFPYIGYFQLINSSDYFVVYDDVAYIKQGWINRNKILVNDTEFIFTIPLRNASSFITINKTEINQALYPNWKAKFYKTVTMEYAKAPYFQPAFDLIASVLDDKHNTICELATNSLLMTSKYLGINTCFILGSMHYNNDQLKGQERIIDICKKENADIYINPNGGRELYSKRYFADYNIILRFLKSDEVHYPQFSDNFVPWLSVIDVLMFNSPDYIKNVLLPSCHID